MIRQAWSSVSVRGVTKPAGLLVLVISIEYTELEARLSSDRLPCRALLLSFSAPAISDPPPTQSECGLLSHDI